MVFVKSGNAASLITQIKNGWNFPPAKDPQKVLRNYFPNADKVAYDVYFQFPMQSFVFVKQVDPNDVEMDCFRADTKDLATDVSRALELLGNLSKNNVYGLSVKPENVTSWQLAEQAVIQGGVYLTLVPVATTALVSYYWPTVPSGLGALIGVVIAVVIFVPLYVYQGSKQMGET